MEEFHVLEIEGKLNRMNLKIKKITKENFLKFGQLISTKNIKSKEINQNTTNSFYDLANIEIYGKNLQPRINIFKAKKRVFPIKIDMLENHPFSSQTFFPLQKTKFIVVVAPKSKIPDLNSVEAFLISPDEGINFKSKVWHFPLIATEDSNFLIIDKKDTSNNLEIFNFKNNDEIILNYE